jgi:hypothetical protein
MREFAELRTYLSMSVIATDHWVHRHRNWARWPGNVLPIHAVAFSL